MLITKFDVSQDKDTSRIIDFTMSLEEVIIVSTEVVAVSPDQLAAGATKQQAAPVVESGRKQATEIENDSSILATLSDWVF